MGKATLVIMAAGLGSRFGGGIKQLEPVGPNGEIIMDYSIYDARKAGFDKVVFVIRRDLEEDFRAVIGKRLEQQMEVAYAYQELDDIPKAFQKKYEDRSKPWGTGQAILCCKDVVKEPFLVINADDYYGKQAYQEAYAYLMDTERQKEVISVGMVGFALGNTLSENGGVTRGLCHVDERQHLTEIVETKNIEKAETGAMVVKDGERIHLPADTPVSMNMWALQPEFFGILETGFTTFLENLGDEWESKEYLLPTIMGELLQKRQAEITVLRSMDKWFGVTYKEDKDAVVASIHKLLEEGCYPKSLFA